MRSTHATFIRPFITLSIASSVLFALYMVFAPSAHAGCSAEQLVGVQYGGSGTSVRALQECLIELGYSIPAGPTGYYGAQTRAAVRAFYTDTVSMPEWHGNSVGPVGRAALVRKAQGTGMAQGGHGYRAARDAADLARYVSAERGDGMAFGLARESVAVPMMDTAQSAESSKVAGSADRVSGTNVQVAGIDEPDIVKTDGSSIFVSNDTPRFFIMDRPAPAEASELSTRSIMPPSYEDERSTKIIDALPPKDMALLSKSIPETGDMLLVKNKKILIVLSHPNIVAYNIADPDKPLKVWEYALKDNTSVVTARLLDDTVYLVTSTYMRTGSPCPIVPMERNGVEVVVPCGDILVPERLEPADSLYTMLALDPQNGTALRRATFVAESGGATVAMFKDDLYVATQEYGIRDRIMASLLTEAMGPYVSQTAKTRALAIQGYDISDSGKLQEIRKIFEAEMSQRSDDERLRIETEIDNSMRERIKAKVREMYRTRVVRMPIDTLAIAATGSVPGHLLNQFALDEHEGNLRMAVTVGDTWGPVQSENDVYVLNGALSIVGSVKGLGETERVYSVRFMGDVGYLVTFRQTDPFYVLDLSVPTAPKVAGELKIPGYSAYLEYLGDDRVLGVGREGSGVKLSVFDVSDPAKPIEKSKYIIKDSWSEVENNHHAFLRDADNTLFFIPGSNGGYIFSYANDALALKHTVAGYGVRRALYLDDYFYVLSDSELTAFDMKTWKEIKSLTL